MKHPTSSYRSLLLYLLLILTPVAALAQPYHSIFGHTSTKWVYAWYNLDFGGTDTAFISGDTVVNGLAWKKLTTVHALIEPNTMQFSGALLREDTVAGKVWYKATGTYPQYPHPNDTGEYLAYRYDLQQGDSFSIKVHNTAGWAGADRANWAGVDSVRYINNLKYIYFNTQNSSEPLTIIEGIGPNTGPLYNILSTGFGFQYLLCTYKDGMQTTFANKRYNGQCGIPLAVPGVPAAPALRIYPDPADDLLHTEVAAGMDIGIVEIVAADGRMVAHYEHAPAAIPVSSLPNGFYYMRCYAPGRALGTQPVLILHP